MTVDAALNGSGVAFFDDRVAPRPGTFTPEGVVIHHTGSNLNRTDAAILNTMRNGVTRPDGTHINGPLCNLLVNRAGEIRLVTIGRANDTGTGNQAVLNRVVADQPVLGDATTPGTISGNNWFFDIEIANNGIGEAYSNAIMTASVDAAAALCRHNGWDPNTRVIGHKEWTSRKIDPSFDMVQFRADVVARVAELNASAPGEGNGGGAGGASPTGPATGSMRPVSVSGPEALFAQLQNVAGVYVDDHAPTVVVAGVRHTDVSATEDAIAQLTTIGFTVNEATPGTGDVERLTSLIDSDEEGLNGFA